MSGLGRGRLCRVVGMSCRSRMARKRIRKAVQGNRIGLTVLRSHERCTRLHGLPNAFSENRYTGCLIAAFQNEMEIRQKN